MNTERLEGRVLETRAEPKGVHPYRDAEPVAYHPRPEAFLL